MSDHITVGSLTIDRRLFDFVQQEALPGSGVDADQLWLGLGEIVEQVMPANRTWLAERDRLQSAIDAWHVEHRGRAVGHRSTRRLSPRSANCSPSPATSRS